MRAFRTALVVGAFYFAVGIVFARLDDAPGAVRFWRLAAWAISGVACAIHIGYEHLRHHQPPRVTALHVALAVAFGACALAVLATVRSLISDTGNPRLLALAIVLWPVMAAIPAFLVALATASILALLQPPGRSSLSDPPSAP